LELRNDEDKQHGQYQHSHSQYNQGIQHEVEEVSEEFVLGLEVVGQFLAGFFKVPGLFSDRTDSMSRYGKERFTGPQGVPEGTTVFEVLDHGVHAGLDLFSLDTVLNLLKSWEEFHTTAEKEFKISEKAGKSFHLLTGTNPKGGVFFQ
jgi:hypothetical protein